MNELSDQKNDTPRFSLWVVIFCGVLSILLSFLPGFLAVFFELGGVFKYLLYLIPILWFTLTLRWASKKPHRWVYFSSLYLPLALNLCAGKLTEMQLASWLPEPRIVLIGPKDSAHWKSFIEGFQLAFEKSKHSDCVQGDLNPRYPRWETKLATFKIGSNNIPVDVFEMNVDVDDPVAFERIIREIASSKDNLIVTGFVTSTEADRALQIMASMGDKWRFKWPCVILPMATSSSLLKTYNSSGNRPILRIVPQNSFQVDPMADAIAKPGPRNTLTPATTLAIFRDGLNPNYSKDLASQLKLKLEPRNVAVVFDGSISSSGPGGYINDSVVALRPDCIVFLGMLETGIPLVRQIRIAQSKLSGTNEWKPKIILSDGSVEKEISGYAQLDQLKGIYGLFPQGPPRGHDEANILFQGPSFAMFGHDCAVYIREILEKATDGITRPNKKKVASALADILKEMNHSGANDYRTNFLVGKYEFDVSQDVSNLRYHLWMFNGTNWTLSNAE